MAPAQDDDENKAERLKAALWYSVGETVDGVVVNQNLNATPHFIGGLSEMLWAQIETVSNDLEAFAKHAGRSTINTKDVLLLGRRNEGLEEVLKQEAERVKKRDARENR